MISSLLQFKTLPTTNSGGVVNTTNVTIQRTAHINPILIRHNMLFERDLFASSREEQSARNRKTHDFIYRIVLGHYIFVFVYSIQISHGKTPIAINVLNDNSNQ